MAGEVLLNWERFVIQPVFKRYAKYAKEPRALFECIGEDLASSSQEVRETAYWALVYAMPKLASLLYEWETRQPGWRYVEGQDQQMANRGMDIVKYLHRKLVVEHRFKISEKYGKDPRPFVNEEIKNKKIDEWRKRKREVLLDVDATLNIPDTGSSLEDSVIEKIALADPEKEFLPLSMVWDEDERALFRTVLLDESPLDLVQGDLGIESKNTVSQRFSRARKHAVADRDALFTFLLITGTFPVKGEIPQFPKNPEMSVWTDQVLRSVRPGNWLNGVAPDGKSCVAVRPLTGGLKGAPGRIYLIAIHKEDISTLYTEYIEKRPYTNERKGYSEPWFDPLTLDNQWGLKYVDKLINPKSRGLQQSRYMYSLIDAYPTELFGLNGALEEISDDYGIWLLSNAIPDSRRIHQWEHGDKAGEIPLRESKQRDVKLNKLHGRCLLSPARIYSMILTRSRNTYRQIVR